MGWRAVDWSLYLGGSDRRRRRHLVNVVDEIGEQSDFRTFLVRWSPPSRALPLGMTANSQTVLLGMASTVGVLTTTENVPYWRLYVS
jgi:hypothetical protein